MDDERFDMLVAQVGEWADAARGLDKYFPDEMMDDLRDLTDEFKAFLDDQDPSVDRRGEVLSYFTTREMIEVMQQHPSVRQYLENAWGPDLSKFIEESSSTFEG